MLCKGKCGKEALFGNWCCESYHKCPGYKKQLSDKAKLRGNNGVRGLLSKKYFIKKPHEKEEFEFICPDCKTEFKKNLLRGTALRSTYKPKCKRCMSIDRSNRTKFSYLNRAKNFPFEKLGYALRKQIIWKEQGQKCNHCIFDKFDWISGPYELHHKDGNSKNHNRDNEELLCRNCHYMTDNWGFKNKKHNEETWNKINFKRSNND